MKVPPPPIPLTAATAPLSVEEDDDYEPDFDEGEDTEQILNKLDAAPPDEPQISPPISSDIALKPFTLPPPLPLTPEEATQVGQGTIARVFGVMQTLEDPGKKSKSGM